jgi:hypothetical protein
MRIVSMVPSWTETLLACGLDVVGKTRFCLHLGQGASGGSIQSVGGTKDWDLAKVKSLRPDLIILDKEENPRSMADEAPCTVLATHITRIEDVARDLLTISQKVGGVDRLLHIASRWEKVCDQVRVRKQRDVSAKISWGKFPGVLEWIRPPQESYADSDQQFLVYVIWKNPWMCVGRDTFIASVLEAVGWPSTRLWAGKEGANSKYPEFNIEDVPLEAVMLFSSEPYPFHKKISEIRSLERPAATVNGESFSWFGLRSLEFLEDALSRPEL